jgi:hypothetical protein
MWAPRTFFVARERKTKKKWDGREENVDKKSESADRPLQSSAVNPWLGLTEVTNPLKKIQ